MLVIFEGIDKSGKTTLLREFLKRSNYKHIVYDRGPISQIVFSNVFARPIDKDLKYVIENLTKIKNLVVLCEADCDIIRNRLKEAGEKLPDELTDIISTKLKFRIITRTSGFNYIIVNTSENSIDECLEMIEKEVERIENDRSL